jgi:hypothetical protein
LFLQKRKHKEACGSLFCNLGKKSLMDLKNIITFASQLQLLFMRKRDEVQALLLDYYRKKVEYRNV